MLALRLLAGVILSPGRDSGDIKVAAKHPVHPDLNGKEQHHILEVAYGTLDKKERTLLSRIAAFRSPMEYDALLALNAYESESDFDAALGKLLALGVLFRDSERGRYDMHPIVRRYAYDRLTDKTAVHSRLCEYFDPIASAMPKKVERIEDLAPVVELYCHMVGAGRRDDARQLYHDRLWSPLFYQFGAYERCIELQRLLFPDGEDRPPRLSREHDQSWTLNALGTLYGRAGQSRRAVSLIERHNKVKERLGDKKNLAIGLGNLAIEQLSLGELAAAEDGFRRRIAPCREIEEEFGEAVGRKELARLLAFEGRFEEAEREFLAALAINEKRGDLQSQGLIRAYLAQRALLMRNGTAALDAARHARELAEEDAIATYPVERDFVRAEWLIGAALVALAAEERGRRIGRLAEAEGHLTDALTRCRRITMMDHEPDIVLTWAKWHRLKGDADAGRTDAEEALLIADRCEYRLCQADIHSFLALLSLDAAERHAAADDQQSAAKERETATEHALIAYERAWCDGPPDHSYKPALDEATRLLKLLNAAPPKMG